MTFWSGIFKQKKSKQLLCRCSRGYGSEFLHCVLEKRNTHVFFVLQFFHSGHSWSCSPVQALFQSSHDIRSYLKPAVRVAPLDVSSQLGRGSKSRTVCVGWPRDRPVTWPFQGTLSIAGSWEACGLWNCFLPRALLVMCWKPIHSFNPTSSHSGPDVGATHRILLDPIPILNEQRSQQ